MDTNNELKVEKLKTLYILLIFVFFLWLIFNSIIYIYIKSFNHKELLENVFGGTSSLFSGLALAGVIYTIYLQKRELALQRQELINTRQELSRSAAAQEKTERALNKQVQLQNLAAELTSLNILMNYSKEKAERAIKNNEERLYHTMLNDSERYSVTIESLLSEIRKTRSLDIG